MANVQSLTYQNYRLHNCRKFLDNLSNSSYSLFAFAGYAVPFTTINASADIIEIPTTDIQTSYTDVWKNMLWGKQITNSGANLVIQYNLWESNTVYVQYDDTNPNLPYENYFVHINDTSFIHCFKCLYNNQNGYSTVQPDITDVNSNNNVFITSDGYFWKYMYSVSSEDVTQFGTSTVIPIVANSLVRQNATKGSIDVVNIDVAGVGYNNYTNGTFSSSDSEIGGNNLIYSLNNALSPSSVNNFYNGCILYISSGTGSGQFANIISYQVNSTYHYVVLDQAFSVVPTNGSEFFVNPAVIIIGDGTETSSAVGMCQINTTAGNSIASVLMLETGSNFKIVSNCYVSASNVVPISINAVVRAIMPPEGGHGYDSAAELQCNTLCLSVTFSNTEQNTIPSNGSYRQIGLLENPSWANVSLGLINQQGTFFIGEEISVFTPIKISSLGIVNATSNIISASDGDFLNQLIVGEPILISSNSQNQLINVSSIINSTTLSISSNASFTVTNAKISLINLGTNAITSAFSSYLFVYNTNGSFSSNQNIIGWQSGATATISNVNISNVTKSFTTFVQMNAYDGYYLNGTFEQGEYVYQQNTNCGGYFDSTVPQTGNSRFYVSYQIGNISAGANLIGSESGAVARITASYQPELIFGDGEILFVENFTAIQRNVDYSETFKIFLNF